MDNQQVTLEELAWLAGIWDGEGSIGVRLNRKIMQISPRIHVVNSNPKIICKVIEILEKLGVKPYVREKDKGAFPGSEKQVWQVGFDTLKHSKIVLDSLFEHLVGKKENAVLLLRFINSRLKNFRINGTNKEKAYTPEELETIAQIYELIGSKQAKGTPETIRGLSKKRFG